MVLSSTIPPPSIFGLRYKYIFLIIQLTNVIRYYTCPDYLNIKMPHYSSISFLLVLIPHALAFLHALDGNKRNWDMSQNFMIIVILSYIFSIVIAIVYSVKSGEKSVECWHYLQDQLFYWHEVYLTFTLFTLARAEAKYFERIDYLEKSTAEYGSTRRPRKFRRRPMKQDEKDEESDGKNGRNRYYH